MTDPATNLKIRVAEDVTIGPYIRVSHPSLPKVQLILEQNKVPHSVKSEIISMSGGPFMSLVYLKREADARAIQDLLDRVS